VADRAIHIAIDGRELVGQPTGVGRYLTSILRVWSDAPGPHRYTIIAPAPRPDALADLGSAFEWMTEPSASPGTFWEQWRLSRAIHRLRPDVLFAPGYTAPLRLPCPSVPLIHDVSFFAHPEWFSAREGARRRWVTRAAAARAASILTVSDFSASEIVRWMDIPASRIRLARPGPPSVTAPAHAPAREPMVLYAGTLLNRRRIPTLIEAFANTSASCPDARLVLVGSNRTRPTIDPTALAASAGVGNRVEWRHYVPDAELEALYWSASVFAFLSDYEGFSMTPLEALAHGVPPVMLDTPVAREIYGPAARLVGTDPLEIGRALADLLTSDAARRTVVDAGRPLLDPAAWTRTADVIRHALEDAAR